MKRKIVNFIAILALMASFALPVLIPQSVWADTVYEQYCASKGFRYSSGGCIKTGNFTKNWCEEQGGSFTPPSSSSKGEARCWLKITGSATTADTPSDNNTSNNSNNGNNGNNNNNESGGGGTSPTSASSNATTGATESSPDQMKKECGEGQVKTSILGGGGCVDIDQDGGNIFKILNTILTVLTYGVGIAGTLGIVISGVQYLTARDNEQQMVKAKSRLVNIVIGLAAYAMMWALLQWLIPGGVLNGGGS